MLTYPLRRSLVGSRVVAVSVPPDLLPAPSAPQTGTQFVHVVQVQKVGPKLARWTFDQDVLEVGNVVGLQVNGQFPSAYSQSGEFTVDTQYPGNVNVGDPWSTVADDVFIIFDPDLDLTDGRGTVVA